MGASWASSPAATAEAFLRFAAKSSFFGASAAAAALAPKNDDFAANLKKASAVAAGEEAHDAPMGAPEEKIELKKDEATA